MTVRYFQGVFGTYEDGCANQWRMPDHGPKKGHVRNWVDGGWSDWHPSGCDLRDMYAFSPDLDGEVFGELINPIDIDADPFANRKA